MLDVTGMRHTSALRYSWFERLHYRLLGYWPQSVVTRRLDAWDRDQAEAIAEWNRRYDR